MNVHRIETDVCTSTYCSVGVHPLVANGIVFIIDRGNSIRCDNVTRARECYRKRRKLDRERPTTACCHLWNVKRGQTQRKRERMVYD